MNVKKFMKQMKDDDQRLYLVVEMNQPTILSFHLLIHISNKISIHNKKIYIISFTKISSQVY